MESIYTHSKQLCPNCNKPCTFTEHSSTSIETHGLDCGPYESFHEEWLTCNGCGVNTDADELEMHQVEDACERCLKNEGTHTVGDERLCVDCADDVDMPEDMSEGWEGE